jgi:hypothetical protein
VKEVDQEKGSSIFDIFKRTSSQEEFKVRTPEAMVMVKGTRFSVGVEDGTAVSVYRGSVGVGTLNLEKEVLVREGFTAFGSAATLELRWTNTPDPWESWASGAPAPLPDRSDDSDTGSSSGEAPVSVDEARADALATADSDLAQLDMPANDESTSTLPGAFDVASLDPRAQDQAASTRVFGTPSSPGVTWEVIPGATSGNTRIIFFGNGQELGSLDAATADSIATGNSWGSQGVGALRWQLIQNGVSDPTDLVKLLHNGTP